MKFFSMQLFALLSAALIVASAPAISANIPAIVQYFPEVSLVYISLLTTIPSLFLILGILLTSFVESLIGRKYTIILGLVIVSIFGTLPAWYQGRFIILFLSRCLLGIGIGLFNRLLIQMISSLYQSSNTKKAKALGLESACEGLGGIIMTIGVGQLLKIDWTVSFMVYGLAFLGVILISIFIPQQVISTPTITIEANDQNQLSNKRKRKMFVLGFLLFCIVILFINFNLQITPLLLEKQIGDATHGSNMIAAIAVGAFIAGNLFGRTYSKLKNWVLPIAVFLAGFFIFLTTISPSVIFTLICSAGLGFAFRNIMPYFMHMFTTGGEEVAKVGTTIVLVAYNLGATLAPYVAQLITLISGNATASTQLMVCSGLFGIIGLITLLFNKQITLTE